MPDRRYYEAYDARYRAAHAMGIRWLGDAPTPIVGEILSRYGIDRDAAMLELGCGEGRDAGPLMEAGCDLLAVDISPEAVADCKKRYPAYADWFRTLDCVRGSLEGAFAFLYAVALLHMLVEDADRKGFYRFVREHLTQDGLALICTMGDGETERQSDPGEAFSPVERTHGAQRVVVAATSCRTVSFETLLRELRENGLSPVETGMTEVPGEFSQLMYAVVRRDR